MRSVLAFALVTVLLLASLTAHAEGVREQRPSLVFGEIGGKAVIFSAGYERYFNNSFGLGVGGVAWGGSGGGVGLFPIYAALHPVGDTHSLYLSGGLTIIAGAANWGDDGDEWSTWVGTFAAGYQYQSEGGFFVRPTFNMLYREDGFVVIPGIAIGGSF